MTHLRVVSLLAALLCLSALALAGCGAARRTEPLDYAAILQNARSEEENQAFDLFHAGPDGQLAGAAGYTGQYTADQLAGIGQASLELLGLDPADCLGFAASVSQMMTQSYAIAVALPAEGKADAVKEGFQAFIQQQMELQQNYLPDQYAIAKDARLETLPTGEVVLVMCQDADAVLAHLKEALA